MVNNLCFLIAQRTPRVGKNMLSVFDVGVSVTFHLVGVRVIFSSVSIAEWSPFDK